MAASDAPRTEHTAAFPIQSLDGVTVDAATSADPAPTGDGLSLSR